MSPALVAMVSPAVPVGRSPAGGASTGKVPELPCAS